jgi:hypothetical protein
LIYLIPPILNPLIEPRLPAHNAALRVHEKINSQGVAALLRQGAKTQEYLDIPSFRNAAARDASAYKM